MKLYHFTSPNALSAIRRHGLTVGDVPTDALVKSKGLIAIWLTDASAPEGHGLGGRIDKKRCRLEVAVDTSDSKLMRWADWSTVNVTSGVVRALKENDGHAWQSWFLYFGWISPDKIIRVLDRDTGRELADWGNHFGELEQIKGVPYWNRQKWQKGMLKQAKRTLERRVGI